MNKTALFFVSISLLFLGISCTKQGVNRFRGNYSFKTSGYISAVRDSAFMFDTSFVKRRDYINDTTITRDTTYDTEGNIIGIRIDSTFSGHWGQEYTDTVVTVFPDSMTVSINTESGQMDIISADGNDLIVTMNCTGGDLVVFDAYVDGDRIVLDPIRRRTEIGFATTLPSGNIETAGNSSMNADFVISGAGRRFENIVLFDLSYRGTYKYNNIRYDITDSDIHCRAKDNE